MTYEPPEPFHWNYCGTCGRPLVIAHDGQSEKPHCPTCRRFSRAYLRHLYASDEMLGMRLLSLHNVHFLVSLMRTARRAILEGSFDAWSRDWLARYHSRPTVRP